MKPHDTPTPASTASTKDNSRDEIARDIARTGEAHSSSETLSCFGSANAVKSGSDPNGMT